MPGGKRKWKKVVKDKQQDRKIARIEKNLQPELKFGYLAYTLNSAGQQNTNAISIIPLVNGFTRGTASQNNFTGDAIKVKRITGSFAVWGNTGASAYNFWRMMIVRIPGARTSASGYITGSELLNYYTTTNDYWNNYHSDYEPSTVSMKYESDNGSIKVYRDIKIPFRSASIEVDKNYRTAEFEINFKNPVKTTMPNGDNTTINNGIYCVIFGGKSTTATDNPVFNGIINSYYYDD